MDWFVELGKSRSVRSTARNLGVPIAFPPALKRDSTRWKARLLDDETVVVCGSGEGDCHRALARTLARSGARVCWEGPAAGLADFEQPGEAYGEPARAVEPTTSGSVPSQESGSATQDRGRRVYGLIADLTHLRKISELDVLYRFFHEWVGNVKTNGRVLLLARPTRDSVVGLGELQGSGMELAELNAVRRALDGFTRSLSKELGRKGITVNRLVVADGAEAGVEGPLRFFLSGHSAFVTGQPLLISGLGSANSSAWTESLRGKLAMVTGGARGIGAATARALAREGARVVIVEQPGAESAGSRLARELGGHLVLLDVAAAEAPGSLVTQLRELGGGVDIVVHNAGVTRDKTLGRMKRDAWDLVLDVNLKAVFGITEALLMEGVLRPQGRIVLVSSVGGIAGNPGQTNYGATKASLIGLAESLAPALASKGITVNAVAPGLIETAMTRRMPAGVRLAARRLSSLNQGGLPGDVAEAIAFLAMPWASGVSGQVLRVCGGALVGA